MPASNAPAATLLPSAAQLIALLCLASAAACSADSGQPDSAKPATTELPVAAADARGADYPNTKWLAAPGGVRHSTPVKAPNARRPPRRAAPAPIAPPSAAGSAAPEVSSAEPDDPPVP